MISGSLVALVTPMHENGNVDWAALDKLIEWHVDQGTDAIVTMGTTGESATIDEQEHCGVIRHVVERVDGRIPVVAGTGANATNEAIRLTRCARDVGADACLIVTPYYNKPTQEGLFLHFKTIAETVDIPQILYNVPGRTAVDMLPETVQKLLVVENIVGIKEASGDLARMAKLRELCGVDYAIYSGDDDLAKDAILQGANGVISVTSNVAPKLMHEMCQSALAGDADAANKFDEQLQGLHGKLFVESNPIPVKWALMEMGMIGAGIRLPLTQLSVSLQDQVRSALAQAGSI